LSRGKWSFKYLFQILLHLKSQFKKNELTALGAQLSYYLILSFFPFLILLIVLLNFTPLTEAQTIRQLSLILPDEVFSLVTEILREISMGLNATLISFSGLGTIWAASRGTSALIKGLNKAYNVAESRPFWKLKIMGVLLTFALILMILISLILLVFGQLIGYGIAYYLGLEEFFITVWDFVRYVFPLVFLFLVFSFFYIIGPNEKLRFRDVYIGALFSTFGWIIISLAFSYYVNHYGAFSRLYGSIGAVIALLIWLNISSLIVLIGGELNATRLWAINGFK